MKPSRFLLPAALVAASILALAYAPPQASAAPPDPAIAAVDQLHADAVTVPAAAPAPANVQAIARVLAIETMDPQATVITAFALMLPARPRPVLALASPFLVNPYDDGVPLAVKLWNGRGWRQRLTC